MVKSFYQISLTALLLCSAPAFAGPTFENVTFGKQSTRCDDSNSSRSIVLDGRGIIVGFNKVRAKVSEKNPEHDAARCDVTLKLAAPLEAPAVIQIDVSGVDRAKGKGAASATVTYLGRTEPLRFQWKDDAGIDRISAKLPQGALQLDLSFEIMADGQYPDSTALIHIDSLDIVFERRQ
ncbi:MAG: hypothetical protein WCK93_12095 [Nitrosomonadales bacterium]